MTLPDQAFIEISIEAGIPNQREKKRMIDFFASCGVPAAEMVFFESPENFRAAVYTRQKAVLQRVRAKFNKDGILRPKADPKGLLCRESQRSFAPLRMTPLLLKSRVLTRKDWLDKWQADYRIMPLGKKFMLVPFWQKKEFGPDRGRLPIYLDPKAAFGSGQHPSTQIMISIMECVKAPFETCLDLGTGTGILSAAAHRLGAKTICAYDLDSVALQAARFNLKLNGAQNFFVRRGNVTRLQTGKQYHLVCANLTPGILTQAKRFVFSSVRKGGVLIVSGILGRDVEDFRRCFTHPGFQCLKLLKKGGWGGLLLKRN